MTLRELREKPPEGPVSATVEIVDLRVEQGFRRRVQRTVARLRDETGEGEAVWFGRRYIERRLAAGQTVAMSGKVELRGWLPRFAKPGVRRGRRRRAPRRADRAGLPADRRRDRAPTLRATHRGRARPGAGRLSPNTCRRQSSTRGRGRHRPVIGDAIEWMHFPPDFERARRARCVGWRSTSCWRCRSGMVARQRQRQTRTRPADRGHATDRYEAAIASWRRSSATGRAAPRARAGARHRGRRRQSADGRPARRARRRSAADLAGERPMMRLLQGDVGSGKTAVAALALAFVGGRRAPGRAAGTDRPAGAPARQTLQRVARAARPRRHAADRLAARRAAHARRSSCSARRSPTITRVGRAAAWSSARTRWSRTPSRSTTCASWSSTSSIASASPSARR